MDRSEKGWRITWIIPQPYKYQITKQTRHPQSPAPNRHRGVREHTGSDIVPRDDPESNLLTLQQNNIWPFAINTRPASESSKLNRTLLTSEKPRSYILETPYDSRKGRDRVKIRDSGTDRYSFQGPTASVDQLPSRREGVIGKNESQSINAHGRDSNISHTSDHITVTRTKSDSGNTLVIGIHRTAKHRIDDGKIRLPHIKLTTHHTNAAKIYLTNNTSI